jgi:tetratricopeptide (TPR) repeat protein
MNELQTALSNNKVRLIGMTAAGGYGKSALAVKFKEQLTPNWRVLWVNFIQPYSLAQFGRWLLEQLGRAYDEKWEEKTLIGQIIAGLTTEPCLLVLDNFETVLTADGKSVYSQFLNKWLHDGINSKLLLTSREKPIFATNLLRHCHWLALEGLAEADAIRLVTEDYGLTGTKKELTHFVNQMGRHPLLMQLVSSWMREELGEVCVTEAENLGLDLFSVEGYHRDDAETSVGKVVAASLARLSSRLGTLLKQLSVLRIAFDLPLAKGLDAEVTEAELRDIARLSLLQESPPEWEDGKQTEQRRFEFLPLIKMFVQQQADYEVLRSAHQAALAYFLAHLPSPPWESLEDLTAYLEGFYHAKELGEWQLAYDILNEERGGEGKNKSVEEFLNFQGFNRRRSGLYESLISVWPLEKKQQLDFGKALNNLGTCYYYLGWYKKAIAYYEQSLEIMESIDNQSGIADSLGNLGNCYRMLGDYEKAIIHHQQSLDKNQAICNLSGIANSFNNLANCYYDRGIYKKDKEDCRKAINYHDKSLKIKEQKSLNERTIYDWQSIANSLSNLGSCYYLLGDYENAIYYYEESLKIDHMIGNKLSKATSLYNMGNTLIKLEKYTEAESKIKESLVISQEINYQLSTANSFKVLADIAHQTNQPQLALRHCQAALTLSQELGIPLVKDCEELLAKILENLGEND